MSSLRWQRMCTWAEFERLHMRIKGSTIGFDNKIYLLRRLQEGGKRAVPEVALEFKQIKRGDNVRQSK